MPKIEPALWDANVVLTPFDSISIEPWSGVHGHEPGLLRNRRDPYKYTIHGQRIPLEQSKRLGPSHVSADTSLQKHEGGWSGSVKLEPSGWR